MTVNPLFTDLYQFTMASAYLSAGKANSIATFELFFRRCPFQGEYAIAAGYDLLQEILHQFKFSKDDIDYLKSLPIFQNADPLFFKTLLDLDLSDVEILAIPEGSLCFPRVPILQVKGPIFKTQLLESALLNAINFATLVATYARRLRMVAGDKGLIEFGLRRAQGPNGAMTASRSGYLGGFEGTSNVLAGKLLQIPVVGTMAHSFIQSFTELHFSDETWNGHSISNLLKEVKAESETNLGELAAFLVFAKTFPDHCILLVDTYDTLASGVPNAIRVFKILKKLGYKPGGIRLDSGDLVYLSKSARRMFDDAGFKDIKIFASNELDEIIIETLQDQGAAIDSYAVGTRLVTAATEPALGGVYKLVEIDGKPRMKISQQTEKLVIPGAKKAFRLYGSDNSMLLDLLTLNETAPKPGEKISVFHPSDPFKNAFVTPSKIESLLQPIFKNGKWLDRRSLEEMRTQSLNDMKSLRPDISRRANPSPYKVSLTQDLKQLLDQLYKKERPAPVLH
ncbi:MAG: nicotinate phosphoribosyltransferase [Bacteriovoracaceae bacterium]|nr:nicotinate phosphoribosyltransferase [Bacteriovoracaceae bacterium]